MLSIEKLETLALENEFVEKSFLNILEDHMFLLKNSNVRLLTIKENEGYKYEGDFYGLLTFMNVPSKYHYVTMRVNDLETPNDYPGFTQILIPDYNIVETLMTLNLNG